MSGDSFSEISNESWFSRIGNSFKGILVGLLLFVIAFPLLWWNEGRAVQTAQSIAEGGKNVVSVTADKVDPANDQKLIHFSGKADTKDVLKDSTFNLELPETIRLARSVEMYQWEEEKKTKTQKRVGGSSQTKVYYEYQKTWSSTLIDSSSFNEAEEHKNPATMPYRSESWSAKDVTVGAFKLSSDLVNQISGAVPFEITKELFDQMPEDIKKQFQISGEYLYSSVAGSTGSANQPQIGDVRVKYSVVKPAEVSIIGEQTGDSLRPFQTKAGDPLLRLQTGNVSAKEMFAQMDAENNMMTWILRLVGVLIMGVGIYMVFAPLVVLADVLPILGNILSYGVGIIAGILALSLSLITIAIAWLFYRPVLGISLLVVAGLIMGSIFFLSKKKTKTA